jgi:hypothetical protein
MKLSEVATRFANLVLEPYAPIAKSDKVGVLQK